MIYMSKCDGSSDGGWKTSNRAVNCFPPSSDPQDDH